MDLALVHVLSDYVALVLATAGLGSIFVLPPTVCSIMVLLAMLMLHHLGRAHLQSPDLSWGQYSMVVQESSIAL